MYTLIQRLTHLLILAVLVFASCAESYQAIDPQPLNQMLKTDTRVKTLQDLAWFIKMLPPDQVDNATVTIGEPHKEGTTPVVIVYRWQDDSVCEEKVSLQVKKQGEYWLITEMQEQWKCCEGRGHQHWGTEKCT